MATSTDVAGLAGGARCALHTEAPAVDTCARCGNYVCASCMELDNHLTYCPDCIDRVSTRGEHSQRAVAALVCGLLPMFTCLTPIGIGAVILGHMELAAIEAGTSPAAGKNLALGGVILGWLAVAATVVGVLVIVAIGLGAWF